MNDSHELTQVVGLSLPLPLWSRNQGAILEARDELAKATDEQRAAKTQIFAELTETYQTFVRSWDTIKTLRLSVLPSNQTAVDTINEGFVAGRFSYLDVLDARRTLTASQAQYLQALADYHKSAAEIEALTGSAIKVRHFSTQPIHK